MKPGDLIRTKRGCLAIYGCMMGLEQLGVVEHSEVLLVLEVPHNFNRRIYGQMIRVLRPNGMCGWVAYDGMEVVGETG